MFVLLCGGDSTLLDLVSLNLARRGHRVGRSDLAAIPPSGQDDVDAIVAELGGAASPWGVAACLRARYPGVPLILFGDDWQNHARLAELQPAVYLRKPFSMGDLLEALRAAESDVPASPAKTICAHP